MLLRWRIEEKEEFDTETPKERLLEESFLSNSTVSSRWPNETLGRYAQPSNGFPRLLARKAEPCELPLRELNELVLEKERSRFNLDGVSWVDMVLRVQTVGRSMWACSDSQKKVYERTVVVYASIIRFGVTKKHDFTLH